MDEFKFVLRCFVFACALLVLTQIKTNGMTIESRIQNTLLDSSVSEFVNQAALGGVKFVENAYVFSKDKINSWLSSRSAEPQRHVVKNPVTKRTSNNSDFHKNENTSSSADIFDDVDEN